MWVLSTLEGRYSVLGQAEQFKAYEASNDNFEAVVFPDWNEMRDERY